MKTFHLNCATMRAWGFFPLSTLPVFGTGKLFRRGLGILHCLLIDTGEELILIDTGFGMQDYTQASWFVNFFMRQLGLPMDINETAIRQIEALGYDPAQVTDIFMTHMHVDHSGGLPDFPNARVHLYEKEYEAIMHPVGFIEKNFYVQSHWAHGPEWVRHTLNGEKWFGVERTDAAKFGSLEVFFVPFPGHSRGQSAVAVALPDGKWLLHAGDTYGYHGLLDIDKPRLPPYAWTLSWLIGIHPVFSSFYQYHEKLRRIRIEAGGKVEIINSHDPYYFELFGGRL